VRKPPPASSLALITTLLVACLLPLAASRAQSADVLREARLARADGDAQRAVELLAPVPEAARAPEATYLLATSYQSLARHAGAIPLLESLAESGYAQAKVLAALARSYDALGQTGQALRAYEAAFAADSSSVPVALGLARLYTSGDRYAEAAALYRDLLARDAGNPALHAYLGRSYNALRLPDSAIVHYQTSHRLNPASVQVALALSSVYASVDHLISARRVLERGLETAPTSAKLWTRRGEVAIKEEDYQIADSAFAEALALGDSSAAAWRGLGVARYFRGQVDSAQVALLASFEADSTHAMTAFYLAMTYQAQEAWDDALGYFDVAATNAGSGLVADLYAQIATTYDRMDRDGDAIRAYRAVQTLAPERPETLFHLAALFDAYYADRAAALRQYEAFLERAPEGTLERMRSYALERSQVLREETFFEARAAEPDTAGGER
jgi:tetratricopeptide (TPR) repeat protein